MIMLISNEFGKIEVETGKRDVLEALHGKPRDQKIPKNRHSIAESLLLLVEIVNSVNC